MLQILFKFFTHNSSSFQRNFIILMISFVFVRFLDFKLVEFWSYLFGLDNFLVHDSPKSVCLLALNSNMLLRTTFIHCFCLFLRVNLMGIFRCFVVLFKNVEHVQFLCRHAFCSIKRAFKLCAFTPLIRSVSRLSVIVFPTLFRFFILFALIRNLLMKCLSHCSHSRVDPLIKFWRNTP
jgi:hypothetical protein